MAKNEKMNDKNLRRVLTCSISCMLVCMICLTGTTWAWFTLEINAGAVDIQIGEPAQVNAWITQEEEPLEFEQSALVLDSGSYELTMYLVETPDTDDLGYANDVYAIMTVVEMKDGLEVASQSYWVLLGADVTQEVVDFYVPEGTSVKVSFGTSWFEPDNALPLRLEGITIEDETPGESGQTSETTEETEESSETAEYTAESVVQTDDIENTSGGGEA